MFDNPILKVNGEGVETLKKVLALTHSDKAVGYWANREQLVFFQYEHDDMSPFPCPVNMNHCADLAMQWLKNTADYGPEPDHDGDNERGWYCFTEGWGHVEPFGYQAFVAIAPEWLMIGK